MSISNPFSFSTAWNLWYASYYHLVSTFWIPFDHNCTCFTTWLINIHWNLILQSYTKCAFYTNSVDYAGRFCLLCSLLLLSYYTQNYAGIVYLFTNHSLGHQRIICVLQTLKLCHCQQMYHYQFKSIHS